MDYWPCCALHFPAGHTGGHVPVNINHTHESTDLCSALGASSIFTLARLFAGVHRAEKWAATGPFAGPGDRASDKAARQWQPRNHARSSKKGADKMKHTQCKLTATPVGQAGWVDIYKIYDGGVAAGLPIISTRHENSEANARRVVACWNAADGIPTEELEAAADGRLLNIFDRLTADRDDLLEALRELVQVSAHLDVCHATVEQARAAIAKAEGGAA